MASVKVAVRVRPFNQREIDLKSKCIIEVEDNKTKLYNAKCIPGESSEHKDQYKQFAFDYSYWSHKKADFHYANQKQLYTDLGTDVVSNAQQGYNACVFAYGQTGSGKTFTMMGSMNDPGLIPRICEALFSSMDAGREEGFTYKVEVSYLEIYNERVKDLIRTDGSTSTHSLRVREHPKLGPYVQDLSKHLVHQYDDIKILMDRGNNHRTTASTQMNDTSSRSHAIFTVTFIQAKLQSDTPQEIKSKIHLVDLAGSERADSTGATGKRLKEGAHINKSLVTLGSVISALAEQSNKANQKVFIPYRDSVLTWLLKDSLGGNSKTIMIATVSPADVNHGESLSTLRYANRAKNIINKPTINEDPNVKLIRELRAEIDMLKSKVGHEEEEQLESDIGSIKAELSKKQAQERVLTDQWTERWKETHKILQEQQTLGLRKAGHGVILDSERPHLVLIDDDLLSTGVTLYHLNDGVTTIGTLNYQDIILQGGGVLDEHCIITFIKGLATLTPIKEAQCWINSIFVEEPTKLSQGCVVVLGGSHMFRYNDPQEAARLRKEGNKSHLNISRLSFLSRSTTDLVRSYDHLPDDEIEIDKSRMDDSGIFSVSRFNKHENIHQCEMSTQTSHHSMSQPTTPIGTHDITGELTAARKASLTLPVVSLMDDTGGGHTYPKVSSINSTPASDTFYTATSILTPDRSELLSPFSPDPISSPSSALNTISHSFHQVPDSKKTNETQNGAMNTSVYLSPIDNDGNRKINNLPNILTSPILGEATNSDKHYIHGKYASTPKLDNKITLTSTPNPCQKELKLNIPLVKDKENSTDLISELSSISTSKLYVSSPDDNSSSLSKLSESDNKPQENNYNKLSNRDAQNINSNSDKENKSSESSGIFTLQDDMSKAFKLIQDIQEKAGDGDHSMDAKVKELEALHIHYAAMEDDIMRENQNDSNNTKPKRPDNLPLDSTILQEERLALLIEREVQRRVLEEVVSRESKNIPPADKVSEFNSQVRESQRQLPCRQILSAPDQSSNPELRILSPSDIRPYSSMSADHNVTNDHRNILYENSLSPDDLLLTSRPLHSQLDYDLGCGFCVSIPKYEMKGAGTSAHWEYEIRLTAGSDSWSVFRRYRRFRELHVYMCHKYGQVIEHLRFPPRKLFGNTSERVVAERRTQLEDYLQQLIITCCDIKGSPLYKVKPSKRTIVQFSTFFQRGVFESSRHSTK